MPMAELPSGDPVTPQVRLDIDARGMGQLVVDGDDMSDAIGEVVITARVGKSTRTIMLADDSAPRLVLGMSVLALIAEGAQVQLRESDQRALIALGWTPPPPG